MKASEIFTAEFMRSLVGGKIVELLRDGSSTSGPIETAGIDGPFVWVNTQQKLVSFRADLKLITAVEVQSRGGVSFQLLNLTGSYLVVPPGRST